jgi:hypothetical protein
MFILRDVLRTIASIILAVILFLVGGRFLILMFGANKDSEIVDWILRHSDFWVKPFFGIAGLSDKAVTDTNGVFEPASAVAFIVYLVIGAIVMSLLSFGGAYYSRTYGHDYDY